MPLDQWDKEALKEYGHNKDLSHLQKQFRTKLAYWGYPVVMVMVITIFCYAFHNVITNINIAMIYILPIVYIGLKFGKRAAVWTACLTILAFNFIFIAPYFSFAKPDLIFIVSATLYLTVGWTIGGMANKIKKQFLMIRMRERRLETLYKMSKAILGAKTQPEIYELAIQAVAQELSVGVIILKHENQIIEIEQTSNDTVKTFLTEWELAAVLWTDEHREISGKSSEHFKDRQGMYIALVSDETCHGIMGIYQMEDNLIKNEVNRNFIIAAANLISTAISKIEFSKAAEESILLKESEKLHSAILNSISHDLHTPLTSIIGSVSSLIENRSIFTPEDEEELLWTIEHEAQRMHRLVKNLLDMTKIESNTLKVNCMWHDIEDLIDLSVKRFDKIYPKRILKLRSEASLPLGNFDFALIEQVVTNLLDNAAKYSDASKPIHWDIMMTPTHFKMVFFNTCHSNKHIHPVRVFEKFYRSIENQNIVGSGLGLSICKGFVEAHHGEIAMSLIGERDVEITVLIPLNQ